MMTNIRKADKDWSDELCRSWLKSDRTDSELKELLAAFIRCSNGEFHSSDHSNCRRQKCAYNPSCLNYLLPEWGDVEEPVIESEKSVAVGIRNLGATCYLNSLLQIWFRNSEFKKGIYEFQGPASGITWILQTTFAKLELSKRNYIDVAPLVNELELSPVIQQDALEFSKLLITMLDSIFKTSGSESVRTLVFNQFQGELVDSITCDVCRIPNERRSPFTELCVNFQNGMPLQEALATLFAGERLEGANQYACMRCGRKQDATKQSRLNMIPRTLNIVVNRFVFDLKTLTKQKVTSRVLFPDSINMNAYLGSKREAWYDLKAALLHKGPNANSGHYFARVFDSNLNAWLDCDDEKITKLDRANFELLKDKKVDPAADMLKTGFYGSSSVYLLVYEKRRNQAPKVELPLFLQKYVEKDNESYLQQLDTKFKCASQEAESQLNRLHLYQQLENEFSIPNEHHAYVEYRLLQKSIDENIEDLPVKGKTNNSTVIEKMPKEIKCSHSKLDPAFISCCKMVSAAALQTIHDLGLQTGEVYQEEDICFECFSDLLENRSAYFQHEQDLEFFRLTGKDDKEHLVSKPWLDEWKKRQPAFGVLKIPSPLESPFREDVYCQHNGLKLDQTEAAQVSKRFYSLLQIRFNDLTLPRLDEERCCICEVEARASAITESELEVIESQATTLKRLLSGRTQLKSGHLIPMKFITEWKKRIKNLQSLKGLEIDLSEYLCEHELFLYKPDEVQKEFYLVNNDEWKVVKSNYKVTKHIYIMLEDGFYSSDPSTCVHCRQERLLNFTKGLIRVNRRHIPNQPLVINLDDEEPASDKPQRRKRRKVGTKAESVCIEITPEKTVKEVMYELMETFQVPPLYQKLFYENKELIHLDRNMRDCGIKPGDELEVEIYDAEVEDFVDVDGQADNGPELGFQGTRLFELKAIPVVVDQWVCKACTFRNASGSCCEICQTHK